MMGGRVVYLALGGGFAIHGLNGYWAVQILAKLRSKWRDATGMGGHAAEGHYYTGWTNAARRGKTASTAGKRKFT